MAGVVREGALLEYLASGGAKCRATFDGAYNLSEGDPSLRDRFSLMIKRIPSIAEQRWTEGRRGT